MAKQISFSKYGNQVLPHFRERLSKAESTEDLKKFFVYISRELLERVFAGELEIDYEDISLDPKGVPHFIVSEKLMADPRFTASWQDSDLKNILTGLAGTTMKRYAHLEKNPEKTEAKIRM
jgi:hypothetical protein